MNHIKNLKYLKSNDIHFYVGWAILIIGLILFVVGEVFWLYILPFQFFFSIGFIIIGSIVTFVPSATRSKDEELDEDIKKYTDELCKKISDNLEKKLKDPTETPLVLGRYILEGEGVIIRKGRKDQKYRSSLYKGGIIAFKKDGLYILQTTLSLISNEQSERVIEIPYSNMPTAKIEEQIINLLTESELRKKEYLLHIEDNVGNEITLPIVNSMIIDEFIKSLEKEVKSAVSI